MDRLSLIFGILILILSCKSSKLNEPESTYPIHNDSINLYAFIGHKISVIKFDPNINNTETIIDTITGDTIRRTSYVTDSGFNTKYLVLKNIYNQLDQDTIEFVAFDHFGRPKFENYEHVMLYISFDQESDRFYHHKYLFDPVEMNNKGVWKGLNGKSVKRLFNETKNGVLKKRGFFD